MSGIIYKTGAGAISQMMRLNVCSNNLANMGTVGFKADMPVFRLDESTDATQSTDPSTPHLSPYAADLEYVTDFTSGPVQTTGNPLDVAIVGNGFFEIQTADGIQYTRNGRFSINPQGVLSNCDGWPVMGDGGEIAINGSKVEITELGEIVVDGDIVGQLKVVDFPQPYNLTKTGGSGFVPSAADMVAQAAENVRLSQGAVETSNVNAIRTMTEMIDLLRVFETYQKVIRAADDTMAKTINEVGSPA